MGEFENKKIEGYERLHKEEQAELAAAEEAKKVREEYYFVKKDVIEITELGILSPIQQKELLQQLVDSGKAIYVPDPVEKPELNVDVLMDLLTRYGSDPNYQKHQITFKK